jgi:hypothetical protein
MGSCIARILAGAALLILGTAHAHAQDAGFVVTLGRDTVQVEQFTRSRDRVSGTVVYRSPMTRVVRYQADLGSDGKVLRYEQSIHRADGTRMEQNAGNAKMTFAADTITREVLKGTDVVTVKTAIADAVVPMLGASLMIPFAYSYVTYELAFAARRTDPARWQFIGTSAAQTAPSGMRVWPIGSDSVELDYFGVARSGLKFDGQGNLLRSDWSATTYKYAVQRVKSVDLDGIARRWAAQDAAGAGLANYSPRDTTRATVDGAGITIEYSRPSQRGRVIWGNVVPWNAVWRLGANMATVLRTDADLMIGDTRIPAGAYSLWLVPREQEGDALLVINKQSGQFGTQYDARQDLVRLPMKRATVQMPVEMLAIRVEGSALRVAWDRTAYEVSIRRSR